MLFNSHEFIFGFLPLVFFAFFYIARSNQPAAILWLSGASLFFYGWWNPRFVPVLITSVCFNYLTGLCLASLTQTNKHLAKAALAIAIALNLLVLAYYKYADFFLSAWDDLTGDNIPLLHIILPLGISFFTFTQIAFLVDVYRGIANEFSFRNYLLFVNYFPHLIAGPVLHHKQMMPQFKATTTFVPDSNNIAFGLTLFTIGLSKKLFLADTFGDVASPVFNTLAPGHYPKFFLAWAATLAYTMQIYFDFSGYSDMALGISRLFNITLPVNFNSPYKAANIIDFWRRWHITLSHFLRDYLYIPLGGNRLGLVRRHINLLVTMLLGGLWHGANYTFLIWGGLHGIYLITNHLWISHTTNPLCQEASQSRLPRAFSVALTFLAVAVAWTVFRSPSLASAVGMLKGLFLLNGLSLPAGLASHLPSSKWIEPSGIIESGHFVFGPTSWRMFGFAAIAATGIVWFAPNSQEMIANRYLWLSHRRMPIIVGIVLATCIVYLCRVSEFLYFQF